MQGAAKNFAIAISLANLLLVAEWFNLVFPPTSEYFAHALNLSGFFSIFLVFSLATAFVFYLTELARRLKRPAVELAVYFTISLLCVIALNNFRGIVGISTRFPFLSGAHFLWNWGHVGNYVKLTGLFTFALWCFFRFSGIWIFVVRNALVLLLLVPFFTLGKISLRVFQYNPVSHFIWSPVEPVSLPPERRVLWMVFDEMDEYFSFQGRPKGLELPAFDRFRKESVYATNAYPPASQTLLSLPSYTTGRLYSEAHPSSREQLELTECGSKKNTRWSEEPTVFSDAMKLGLQSAIVGWYLPYCRTLRGTYDLCNWVSGFQYQYHEDLQSNLLDVASRIFGVREDANEIHGDVQEAVLRKARRVVVDPRFGLTFLHWPVPHHPGIRGVKGLEGIYPGNEEVSGYFGNLVLADRTLQEMRHRLEVSGLWDHTTVIVTSDHYWRFAPEKFLQERGDTIRHYQVPLMIKLAGHVDGVAFSGGINTVVLRDLVGKILTKEVTAPAQLVSFLKNKTTLQANKTRSLPGTRAAVGWRCGAPAEQMQGSAKDD